MAQMVATPPLGGIQLAVNTSSGGQLKILAGTGNPNASSTDSSASDLANACVGSLFLRMDGGTSTTLYVKEGATSLSNPTGVWAAK